MANFPTLSVLPSYPLAQVMEDQMIRSPLEAGYQHRRPKYTKRRRTFSFQLHNLNDTDISTLESFENGDGLGAFNWTHPKTSTVYAVYLAAPISYSHVDYLRWSAAITLIEV